ncbi:ISAs1 family transposase [Mesorhizobium sp. ASY16-5R]|uniref:ISAs1 family transposase n=1 Tax=Mesorhizobium sp. ASY16-5R TaxID=3445772 RepID=UPI003FA17AD5
METIQAAFGHLDPRDQNARHDFCEILFIAFAAMLCGARNCSDIWRFGQEKEAMLRQVLTLSHGIPSHDTFSALFRKLVPQAFAEAFAGFMQHVAAAAGGNRQVALDGKAMRGAFEKGRQFAPRMMVSAWGTELRMTLAALPAKGGNEARAAIDLLGLIDLRGAVVTADALHCSAGMAEQIVRRGGDYVLALKGNREALLADAEHLLARAVTPRAALAFTREEGHGRQEWRQARVVRAPGLGRKHGFPGLAAIGEVRRTRVVGDKRQEERCLYVLSRPMAANDLLAAVRSHWDIENGLHWQLDVIFREDECRTRKDHGPENLALLRRFCVNTFRADSKNDTMRGKMMRAGWNDAYLFQLITHMR